MQKYSGFEFDDDAPKEASRTEYENILYLERPGCNLCMGNQEKAARGDTVMATSTRLFKGRVVEDAEDKEVPASLYPGGGAIGYFGAHPHSRG